MKQSKKVLKFNKIKIANVNFIKGGDDDVLSANTLCETIGFELTCEDPPIPASDLGNPCSDDCIRAGRTSANQNICFRPF